MVTTKEYFTVELSSQIVLGIPLDEMTTVVQFEASNICAVPGVADFWHGVANFKGSLLWILDSDRFFEIQQHAQKLKPKLTAVVIKNKSVSEQKQVAIITQSLLGIKALEISGDKSVSIPTDERLAQCCSGIGQTEEAKNVHILDSATLLQHLHQQSILVST
ncbi:MAG: chemotaxis protein CheW [Cyanobacteria bacterium J06600_6]